MATLAFPGNSSRTDKNAHACTSARARMPTQRGRPAASDVLVFFCLIRVMEHYVSLARRPKPREIFVFFDSFFGRDKREDGLQPVIGDPLNALKNSDGLYDCGLHGYGLCSYGPVKIVWLRTVMFSARLHATR